MSLFPSRDEFLTNAREGIFYPLVRQVPLGNHTPVSIYSSLRTDWPGFILESGKVHRHSIVGTESCMIFSSKGRMCTIESPEGRREVEGNPFDVLESLLEGRTVVSHPMLEGFSGGAVGYFTYDMARHIERLPEFAVDDLELPESLFIFIDRFYQVDHHERLLTMVYVPCISPEDVGRQYDEAVGVLEEMERKLEQSSGWNDIRPALPHRMESGANLTPEEFQDIVRKTREYIMAGDIFQANLSVRFHEPLHTDPFVLYRTLREINPSPYMAYLDFPDYAVVSASPELLIKVRGEVIETRPIAGTRPRGRDEEEDNANVLELIGNEKERAEHLMLVDLERNDIGRVARYGSVEVDEFMGIEKYSHVIHIVSNVRGTLAEGKGMMDAVRACFPGGTITGAPKVRAMEIIDELEPHRRGIYTGSIGWLGYDGNAELNIAIRTILTCDGIAYVQAGAGIVADSIPEAEYKESARKAQAALEAVRLTNERTGSGRIVVEG